MTVRYLNAPDDTLKVTSIERCDADRLYVGVNGLFDVRLVKTDEGLVIDVFPFDGIGALGDAVATLAVFDSEVCDG